MTEKPLPLTHISQLKENLTQTDQRLKCEMYNYDTL